MMSSSDLASPSDAAFSLEEKPENPEPTVVDPLHYTDQEPVVPKDRGLVSRLYHDPWVQIGLAAFTTFCNPGMFNALQGMGGSGKADPTDAANGNVALNACQAASSLVLVGIFYRYIGERKALIFSGWAYAFYSGSLLASLFGVSGAFIIAASAILGLCAAFWWVAQGTIITTYSNDDNRGMATGIFWCVFNLGATMGSFISLGINYDSTSGSVSVSTYGAFIAVMAFGWLMSVFICPSGALSAKYTGNRVSEAAKKITKSSLKSVIVDALKVLLDWRVVCLYPMFYNANVFYSYQQNSVNGDTFTLRARSLNSALYWIAQMFGGLIMGAVMDMTRFNRQQRAIAGWSILFVLGMAIWGGGYKFQVWNDQRMAAGHKQDFDFKPGRPYVGPMFLYFFYGFYDSVWQCFCYWIIGAQSRDPIINAIVVGAYGAIKPAGAAMAWRINAEHTSAMTQFAMNWGLSIGSLVFAIPSVVYLRKSVSEVVSDPNSAIIVGHLEPDEKEEHSE